MTPEQAKTSVAAYDIPVNVDFFTLTSEQVKNVTAIADIYKYKRPKNSQGSKARHFYKELMRHFKGELK